MGPQGLLAANVPQLVRIMSASLADTESPPPPHSAALRGYASLPDEVHREQRPSELSARPILNSFGEMMRLDLRHALQIRNRPRQLQDAVEGTCAHAQL